MKAELKTLEDTLGDLETEALIVTLPDTPLKEKAETFGDTMDNAKGQTVDPLADTPQPVSAKPTSTLHNVKVKALVLE